jgi:hypothetical protein
LLSAVVLSPPTAAAQATVQPRAQGAAIDLQKFLPPVAAVPWLDARSRAPQKNASPLTDRNASALLLAPEPATSWAPRSSHAASASPGFARM